MNNDRVGIFDRWAADYDRSVAMSGEFPFIGYEMVLTQVVSKALPVPGLRVLDLGIGTGNLAQKLAGCEVWGLDFSGEMLEQARYRQVSPCAGVLVIAADR